MRKIIICILILLLTACSEKKCLEFHEEIQSTFTYVGKILVPLTRVNKVCDKYENPELLESK